MKNPTYASTKFLLAALGLAFVKAGQVLVEESSKLDAMDAELDDGPTAPATPAPVAQITAADITAAPRDKNGLPWDERIHSGNKTQNQDGSWKKRKGVDDAIVDAVTAELRAITGTAAPAPVADAAPAPVADAAPAPVAIPAPPAPIAVAVPVPVIAAPVIAAPAPAPAATPYTELCDFLAKNTGDGHALNNDWTAKYFEVNGTTLPALATDLDKSAKLLENLRATLASAGIAEVK
jgi:hypothetical protein